MSDRMEESIQEVYSENDKQTGGTPEQEEPMGILGWMNPEEYSFDCMLRMERFQIAWMLDNPYSDTDAVMAAALKANPKVAWVFEHKCPEMAGKVRELTAQAPKDLTPEQIRAAEVAVLGAFEDFVIYTTPEVMAEKCDFIYGWNKERLFELCDLDGKTVLDVGSGTGRLAFAAAEKAAFVVASEPVDSLREFMRDEIARKGIRNMRVCDGLCECLPFPDNSFDVVMSGHVVGDNVPAEVAELTRVTRSGFDSFCLVKIRSFCEVTGRVLLFAVFSFKSQDGYFKQKLLWGSSLSQGATMPGERWYRKGFGVLFNRNP